jgi:HlyD family secretion protein
MDLLKSQPADEATSNQANATTASGTNPGSSPSQTPATLQSDPPANSDTWTNTSSQSITTTADASSRPSANANSRTKTRRQRSTNHKRPDSIDDAQLTTSPVQKSLFVSIGFVLTLIAIVAAVMFGVNQLNSNSSDNTEAAIDHTPDWHTAQNLSFDITVIASGELEARDKITIKSEVEGKATIKEVIPEGSFVVEGAELIKIADDLLVERILEAKQALVKAESDAIAKSETLAIEASEADSLQKAAELKVKLAELELKKWTNGSVIEERNKLDLDIVEATDNLVIAERNHKDSETLLDRGFISKSEFDDDKLKLKQATAALATAQLAKKVYNTYTFPQEEKKYTSDLQESKAALLRTVRKNRSKLTQAEAAKKSAEDTLVIKRDKHVKLEDQLAKCTITAPRAGLVVYATSIGSGRYRSPEPIQQGRTIVQNESLIILPDTKNMVASLKVNESRVSQVKQGQKTSITIDAMKGKIIQGEVISIGVLAESGGYWSADVRQFEVKIKLPPQEVIMPEAKPASASTSTSTQNKARNRPQRGGKRQGPSPGQSASKGQSARQMTLKPGMRCSAEIFVERVENKLAVPVHAVFTEKKHHFVYLQLPSGRVKKQNVTIGKASETYVQITKGLNENDTVLLRKPHPGEVEEQKD